MHSDNDFAGSPPGSPTPAPPAKRRRQRQEMSAPGVKTLLVLLVVDTAGAIKLNKQPMEANGNPAPLMPGVFAVARISWFLRAPGTGSAFAQNLAYCMENRSTVSCGDDWHLEYDILEAAWVANRPFYSVSMAEVSYVPLGRLNI